MPDHIQLAQQLADARANKTQVDSTPYDAISSLTEAYELQTAAIACYPSRQSGYKVGATNEGAQKLFNCDAPFYGPMFERDCCEPGAIIELRSGVLGGEAEFAFLCGSDFPTNRNLSVEELPDLVSRCHIAVEIVGRRTEGEGLPSLKAAVADFGVHLMFLEGPEIPDWKTADLAAVQVTAKTNGDETNSGTGAAVLGHPLNSLLWMHNALQANGSGLKAGDWVSTGTCLGVIKPEVGTVEIEFSGCGTISYTFS